MKRVIVFLMSAFTAAGVAAADAPNVEREEKSHESQEGRSIFESPLEKILVADSDDDFGACYQTYRFSGQTQCNEVTRAFCMSSVTISAKFVLGGRC